ncbi:hypothetical protein JCM11491_002027 [Sporobolomyces phaffii]
MMPSAVEQDAAGSERPRRSAHHGGEDSNQSTPDPGPEGEMDELVDEEEEDQRSNDASSEGGDREDADPARPSTSGTRTNSTSSTANEGSGTAAVPTKTQAAFVHKLWSMLYTPALSNLIAWTDDGRAFTVFHPTEFARAVLPQFFKHSNFASFIRQLNMYGFGKRVNDALGGSISNLNSDGSQVQAWEFQNQAFQRDRPDLLAKIRRKSAKPMSSIRRSTSVLRTAPSASTRREVATSDGGGDDDEPAPRVGTVQSLPTTPSVLFGDGPVPASNGVKIVAGLTEFAPQASHYGGPQTQRTRPKEEYFEGLPSRSPGSYARHNPPYPPPPPPQSASYYHPSSSHHSPRSQVYPLAPPAFYSSTRQPPPPEESAARQILHLESQVRSLGEALYTTQQDFVATKAASYSVLGMLLGIVADLDVTEKRREQIEACSSALSKLHPDIPSHAQTRPMSQSGYPPHLSQSSNYPPSYPQPPNGQPPLHTLNHQHYNRIPPAESYTRSSRPDSALNRELQAHSAPPPPPAPPLSLPPAFRPSSTPQPLVRPASPTRPSTSESSGTQSTPSGIAAQPGYPSPRGANWPNVNPNSNRPTSLPSLSSLLEGVPANGDRRAPEINGRESEPPDERVRKKMRQ